MNILSKDIEPDEGFVKQYCETAYIRSFPMKGWKQAWDVKGVQII